MIKSDIKLSKMKRDILMATGLVCLIFWMGITYYLFSHKPPNHSPNKEAAERNRLLEDKIDALNTQLKEQYRTNSLLLDKLKVLTSDKQKLNSVDIGQFIQLIEDPASVDVKQMFKPEVDKPRESSKFVRKDQVKDIIPDKVEEKEEVKEKDEEEIGVEPGLAVRPGKPVIPVLLFSCNRVAVRQALDLLLAHRPSKDQFPIIVTQDCGHKETREVIQSYGDQVIYIQQPDLSEPVVPAKEKKFRGYFKIARHYGWALNQTFMEMGFDQVIIVEDDLEIAPDFYEYFSATLPVLRADPSLWCVSAWNDNGKAGLINQSSPELLYRTDFFPGLGWMLTRELWQKELMTKWPRSYWDDWMRQPEVRRSRSCIRPEVSRTKTFGKIGVSNGLFFEKHLKYIVLNNKFVPFTVMDLSFLKKDNYDKTFVSSVYAAPVVSLQDLKAGRVGGSKAVRLTYHTRDVYKRSAKALGIMDDFKSGVPRMAYRGIVSFTYSGTRVYLAPNTNWPGYDPKWS